MRKGAEGAEVRYYIEVTEVRECGRRMEVEHDIGLMTWLQLMCCALVPRTRCPLISEVEVEIERIGTEDRIE